MRDWVGDRPKRLTKEEAEDRHTRLRAEGRCGAVSEAKHAGFVVCDAVGHCWSDGEDHHEDARWRVTWPVFAEATPR